MQARKETDISESRVAAACRQDNPVENLSGPRGGRGGGLATGGSVPKVGQETSDFISSLQAVSEAQSIVHA